MSCRFSRSIGSEAGRKTMTVLATDFVRDERCPLHEALQLAIRSGCTWSCTYLIFFYLGFKIHLLRPGASNTGHVWHRFHPCHPACWLSRARLDPFRCWFQLPCRALDNLSVLAKPRGYRHRLRRLRRHRRLNPAPTPKSPLLLILVTASAVNPYLGS